MANNDFVLNSLEQNVTIEQIAAFPYSHSGLVQLYYVGVHLRFALQPRLPLL